MIVSRRPDRPVRGHRTRYAVRATSRRTRGVWSRPGAAATGPWAPGQVRADQGRWQQISLHPGRPKRPGDPPSSETYQRGQAALSGIESV